MSKIGKKLLVLVQAYPSKQAIYNMSYVHSRHIEYLKQGVCVEVISFSALENYIYEGVNVFTKNNVIDIGDYDAVVSHAPNIRNHYVFIKRNLSNLSKVVFVYHGHEALFVNEYYPKPFAWNEQEGKIKRILRSVYDVVKLKLLKDLMKHGKVTSIYVSQWMRGEALKCLGLSHGHDQKNIVINNPINYSFYEKTYTHTDKLADFITIRPLDDSKYAVDLVVAFARKNPSKEFHIYGKGRMFDYIDKPANITVFSEFIEQKNIPNLLNKYVAAVMPTRLDAQGVMMCEMVSYGIPTIVSDLPVCREMLNDFENCIFIDNERFNSLDADTLALQVVGNKKLLENFAPSALAKKELDFILNGA